MIRGVQHRRNGNVTERAFGSKKRSREETGRKNHEEPWTSGARKRETPEKEAQNNAERKRKNKEPKSVIETEERSGEFRSETTFQRRKFNIQIKDNENFFIS